MSTESVQSLVQSPSHESETSLVSDNSAKQSHKRGASKRPFFGHLIHRLDNKVLFQGVDMTPMTLESTIHPAIPLDSELPPSALDFDSRSMSSDSVTLRGSITSSIHLIHQHALIKEPSSITLASLTLSLTGSQSYEDLSTEISSQELIGADLINRAPSAFQVVVETHPSNLPVRTYTVIELVETPTWLLYERRSYHAQVDTSDAAQVLEENAYFESMMSNARGRSSRTTVEAEMQTSTCLHKSRGTCLGLRGQKNHASHATNYMIYDATVGEGGGEEEGAQGVNKIVARTKDEEFQKLKATVFFKEILIKMERVLASNNFDRQQRILKGYGLPDPLRLDVEFKYTLDHLWTFTCAEVVGRAVTALCWNPLNHNLLVVGYGKFHHAAGGAAPARGVACCWSVKNPTTPERVFHFDAPVTSLDFSKDRPNLLGVALYDGSVHVMDVASVGVLVIAKSNRVTSPSYEPIWQLLWYPDEQFNAREEQILVTGQDGRVSKYRNDEDFTCQLLMRIFRMEGDVKGIEQPRQCRAHDIPVSQHAAVLALVVHEGNYYVGTDEGTVHKCSLKNVDQHLDLFVAHNGPIYSVQFSPFSKRVFLTCGADWCVRVWAEGVYEPLVTFTTTMDAMQGAAWSPINATVLASIAGDKVHMWDLTRKTFVPASVTTTDAANTVVQFTRAGDSLLVGDVTGSVHVYALQDMPFSQHYQQDTLVDALLKALKTRPDIVAGLRKTGPPFST